MTYWGLWRSFLAIYVDPNEMFGSSGLTIILVERNSLRSCDRRTWLIGRLHEEQMLWAVVFLLPLPIPYTKLQAENINGEYPKDWNKRSPTELWTM